MKKILFSCMTISVLAVTSAFAEGNVYVATKDYVDAGLHAVYDKTKAVQQDVNALKTIVGTPAEDDVPGTGLVGRIEQLEAGGGGGGASYSANGLGVTISAGNDIGISGLTQATGEDHKTYVFQDNTATELEFVKNWVIEE